MRFTANAGSHVQLSRSCEKLWKQKRRRGTRPQAFTFSRQIIRRMELDIFMYTVYTIAPHENHKIRITTSPPLDTSRDRCRHRDASSGALLSAVLSVASLTFCPCCVTKHLYTETPSRAHRWAPFCLQPRVCRARYTDVLSTPSPLENRTFFQWSGKDSELVLNC